MNLGVATHLLWQTTVLLTITYTAFANPAEEFLNNIIAQLKHQKVSDNYNLFHDELFRATSRSSEEYQIHETPESQDSPVYQQNHELDQSQNQIIRQFDPVQHQAVLAAGNDVNQHLIDPQIVGLQQFNINGYLHLPEGDLHEQNTKESYDNVGPHLFNPLEANHGQQIANLLNQADDNAIQMAVGTLDIHDPQLALQNLQNTATPVQVAVGTSGVHDPQSALHQLQSTGAVSEGAHNGEPLVPTYYFYNPQNAIDDNLLDDTINAMKPLEGESLIGPPPDKKFIVEPLFVAMAGFVGIAMIFMSAVLFLPKLLTPPPQVSSLKGPQELAALTKLAVETIEGKDCTERIACEVGRAMRSMQVSSKPIRVLEVLLPEHLAKQLAQVRKAVANKKTCKLIQCKRSGFTEAKPKIVDKKEPKAGTEYVELHTKIDDMKISEREPQTVEVKIELAEKKTPKITTEGPKSTEKKTFKTTTVRSKANEKKIQKSTKATTVRPMDKKTQAQTNTKNSTESYFTFLF